MYDYPKADEEDQKVLMAALNEDTLQALTVFIKVADLRSQEKVIMQYIQILENVGVDKAVQALVAVDKIACADIKDFMRDKLTLNAENITKSVANNCVLGMIDPSSTFESVQLKEKILLLHKHKQKHLFDKVLLDTLNFRFEKFTSDQKQMYLTDLIQKTRTNNHNLSLIHGLIALYPKLNLALRQQALQSLLNLPISRLPESTMSALLSVVTSYEKIALLRQLIFINQQGEFRNLAMVYASVTTDPNYCATAQRATMPGR